MDRICYKSVYYNSLTGVYSSALQTKLPIDYTLSYVIGRTTYPRIGRIFVFVDLSNAFDFYWPESEKYILKGIATNVGRPKFVSRSFNIDFLSRFWESKKKRKSTQSVSGYAPGGSFSCDSFTPLEVIVPLEFDER